MDDNVLETRCIEEDDECQSSVSSKDSESPVRPRKRARAVADYIRPGERVHPTVAYHGTQAHTRAMSARPEVQVLSDFLVPRHATRLMLVRARRLFGGQWRVFHFLCPR